MNPTGDTSEYLSRSEVVLKGALAAGALYGLRAIGPYVQRASALIGENDLDSLNFLLQFEYLQSDLYNRSAEEVRLKDASSTLIKLLGSQEKVHIAELSRLVEKLGGKPAAKVASTFTFTDASTFLTIAESLELSAIGAYNGVMPKIKSKSVLETLGQIVQVEGRHEAAIRLQKGEEPTPEALDEPLGQLHALESVEKYTGPAIYRLSG